MIGYITQIGQKIRIICICSNVWNFAFVILPQMLNFHNLLQTKQRKYYEMFGYRIALSNRENFPFTLVLVARVVLICWTFAAKEEKHRKVFLV